MQRVSTKEREKFIAAIREEVDKCLLPAGMTVYGHAWPATVDALARRLLRWGRTYGRLAEAQCNGDYPCDNGERKVVFCHKCEGGYVPHSFKGGTCPSCHAERRLRIVCGELNDLIGCSRYVAALAKPGEVACFWPIFSGDPRGNTVKLRVPSGRTDDWGQTGISVPTS